MDKLQLIKKLDYFNINSNIGLAISEKRHYDKFGMTYSKYISDFWYNCIDDINVNSKDEFYKVLTMAEKEIKKCDRKMCMSILPTDEFVYNNREYLFDKDKFELIFSESWQIFTDFEDIHNISTNCNLNITLGKTIDMSLFGEVMYQSFSTGDLDDPYGVLDTGYKEAYINFKNKSSIYESEFYIIKSNNDIVGVVNVLYDNKIFGIYGLALKAKYRNRGIGKTVLKQLLIRCRKLNRKIAFLQTEKGFYPELLYKKIGFREVCVEYYYLKKDN